MKNNHGQTVPPYTEREIEAIKNVVDYMMRKGMHVVVVGGYLRNPGIGYSFCGYSRVLIKSLKRALETLNRRRDDVQN